MSAHAQVQGQPAPDHAHGHHANYVKIWAILVGLLMVSVLGPMAGIRWLTLVAAFGVALVKAYMVAKNFMHLDVQKPIVHWILGAALALMVLLYGALAPDVQKGAGQQWKKGAGFHHSFTTSKPREAGEHAESERDEEAAKKAAAEHGKP
jgi:caa(3)-type oxidase subunit IV